MHQNTVPVVIQDKNGKTTTVHRKNETLTPTAGSSLPSPALGTVGAPTIEQAMNKMREYGLNLETSSYGKANIGYLATKYPRVLNNLLEAVSEAEPDTLPVWENRLGEKVMFDEDNGGDDDEDETPDYRNGYYRLIKTIPLGRNLFPDKDPLESRRHVDRLIVQCELKMGWRPMQKSYTEVQAAMIAVVASGKGTSFEFKGRMDDIFWMADNFSKVESVLPEILKRGDTSRGYIESLLETTRPLSDGVL